MTIKQAIQRVKEEYSAGTPSDDTRLRSLYVWELLCSKRAALLSDKRATEESYSYFCVEMEKSPLEACLSLAELGCTYYRSKALLPDFIEKDRLISMVSTPDGSKTLALTTWEELRYIGGNRYGNKKDRAFIFKGRLWSTSRYPVLQIKALIRDVSKIYSGCALLAQEFPIQSNLEDQLFKSVIGKIKWIFNKYDQTNDSENSKTGNLGSQGNRPPVQEQQNREEG